MILWYVIVIDNISHPVWKIALQKSQKERPEDSPAPVAASACAAVTPAVCCDPPESASWPPGGPCAGEAAWLLQ